MGKGGEEEDGGRLGKDLLGEMISQLGERRHKKEWFVVSWMTNDHFRGFCIQKEKAFSLKRPLIMTEMSAAIVSTSSSNTLHIFCSFIQP